MIRSYDFDRLIRFGLILLLFIHANLCFFANEHDNKY